MPVMPVELTLQSFEPLVGGSFECRCPEGGVVFACSLREASALRTDPAASNSRQPFSLLFLAAVEEVLPQQIYSLSHPEFAEPVEIFLVPVGQAEGGLLLEAVFN